MARVALLFTLTICIVIVLSGVEGKKNGKSKQAKAKKIQDQENVSSKKTKEEKNENEEQGFMKSSIQQSSLPGIAVAQSSLPAATKESDGGHVTSSRGEETASGDDEEMSGSGNVEEKKDENANKPSKVKSKIHVEKDKNKIAESVKKSTVAKNTEKEKKNEKSANAKKDAKTADKATKKDKENKEKQTKETKEKEGKKQNDESKQKKSSKPSHHHHHHHHHHKHQAAEKKGKAKRPVAQNDANKPKVDYPTFNWTKDGNKIKKVAQIPGWASNAGYNAAQMAAMGQMSLMTQMAPMGQMAPMAQGIPVAQIPQNAIQRDTIAPVTAQNLLNGTINNQADIASIDKASMDTTSQSSQRDKTTKEKPDSSKTQEAKDNSTITGDASKDPVAATVASDTGEVPKNITAKAEVKVPSTIPSRCVNLVKSYTDGELTLHDYLKQMRKCKKADREFNSMHPFAGNAMLRDAISKNGPVLTKEAYKYALERVRNYVPSSKEKQAADMILAKWRSNSFGNRDKVEANGVVPDAIKSFMTGQVPSSPDKKLDKEEQTRKAIDTAKQFILGTINGRAGDVQGLQAAINKETTTGSSAGEKKATIVTSPKQNVVSILNAAKSLLTGEDKGHAILIGGGGANAAVVPLPDVKKQQIASAQENKAKALKMAETANSLSAAMLSQLSPNVITSSEKVSSNLLAALKDMGSGPEAAKMTQGLVPGIQKRSEPAKLSLTHRRKRSLLEDLVWKNRSLSLSKRRKKRQMREKSFDIDNPSERSKLNKPVIPAPKLMDKIRDMSMIIQTP